MSSRCDGRGFQVTKANGDVVTDEEALDYWAAARTDPAWRLSAHPESGGMSLTLRGAA